MSTLGLSNGGYDLRRLYLEYGAAPPMDKITIGLLSEFSSAFAIDSLQESERFEHFAAYLTVRKHYSETSFSPTEIITGNGNDTGIDAIAIIINNNLVTDVDDVDNLLDINGYLDVNFVFVQAERSPHFESAKIGQFGYGVRDFFGEGTLKRNQAVKSYAEIMDSVYSHSSKFQPGNPSCFLYYVTTGKVEGGGDIATRIASTINDLENTSLFSKVGFEQVGADQIQKLYTQTTNAITREFIFDQRTVVSDVTGVEEAFLGYLPATEFLKIICDDDGKIIKSIFYENVRDWVRYNEINQEIRSTLKSSASDRFILMNNGMTIIARSLKTTGNKILIGGFHVVNGCQTSYVLNDNKELLNESVRIPFRLICTQDDGVIESIIRATNRQTAVSRDQFFAMKDFAKKLELYFRSFPTHERLYYERRSHQYDDQDIPKVRIIVHHNLIRAMGAVFLGLPHITTRTFRRLSAKVGEDMFVDTDKPDPYYVAALALFRLEQLFNAKKVDARYKPARYQILLAARLLIDNQPLPRMNSTEMEKRCKEMSRRLWDDDKIESLFSQAIQVVERIAGDDWDRDSIRTEPVTRAIFEEVSLQASQG